MAGKKQKSRLLPQKKPRTAAVCTVDIAQHSVTPKEKTPATKKNPGRSTKGNHAKTPAAKKKVSPAKKSPSKTTKKAKAATAKTKKVAEIVAEEDEEEEMVEEIVEGMSEETPLVEAVLTPQTKVRSATPQAQAASKSKRRQPATKKNARVKARCSILFHCLPAELQHCIPKDDENFVNYFGTVEAKTKGCKASHDIHCDFCRGGEITTGLWRNMFTTLKKGEDEIKVDPRYEKRLEEEAMDNDALVKPNEETQTEKEFCEMDKEELLSAKTFAHKPNNGKNSGSEPIVWNILDAKEDTTDCPEFKRIKKHHDKGPGVDKQVAKDLQTMKSSFYTTCSLPWKGLQRLCFFCTNKKAECYQPVNDRNLKFHDETEAENPDLKLHQAALPLVKGAVVSARGIVEHWKSGKLESGLNAADFGQHMELNEFKAIAAALPCMWSDPNYCHKDKHDRPWETFVPFTEAWNAKQQSRFANYNILTVDESMVAWVPKTSKLGSLPNYTLEPRKPKPLGTMLKDIAEVQTGILTFADPLMPPLCKIRRSFDNRSPLLKWTREPIIFILPMSLRHCDKLSTQALNPESRGLVETHGLGSVACCIALKKHSVAYIGSNALAFTTLINFNSSSEWSPTIPCNSTFAVSWVETFDWEVWCHGCVSNSSIGGLLETAGSICCIGEE